jgi:hypothetical protein
MNTFPSVRAFLLPAIGFVLSACANITPPPLSQKDLVGTWRWTTIGGHSVEMQPFYLRFYPDGRFAEWPAPKGWDEVHGVSHARYWVTNGVLMFSEGQKMDDVKIRHNRLYIGSGRDGWICRRIVPEPEPGRLENGKPAGYMIKPI